ncbi:MAG: GerMN domain-containing protein [Eubacteriales bacterium]
MIHIKKPLIIILLFTILLNFSGCSPLISDNDLKDDVPIFPGDTSKAQAKDYMLYFMMDGESYLTPEIRTLTIPESRSIEETLIKQLIAGPKGGSSNIVPCINENTRLISVEGKEDVLFVSLSDQFLTPPVGLGQDIEDIEVFNQLVLDTRKMALFSIANTITEMGTYSFVQFYIDYDNNGNGTRPTRKEMGFLGEGENQLMEPIYRNTDLIFSPVSSISTIMNAVSEKNWEKVLKYTSIADEPNASVDELARQFELNNLSLLEYNIVSDTVSLSGDSAVVVLNYTFAIASGTDEVKSNISVKMVFEDGIWKCTINSLNHILLGE